MLEEDGTELDDDELLFDLPPHTALMILQNNETWTPGRVCMCICASMHKHLTTLVIKGCKQLQ